MRLTRYARPIGFVILGLVTVFGLYQFAMSDWESVTAYWRGKLSVLPLILLLLRCRWLNLRRRLRPPLRLTRRRKLYRIHWRGCHPS